MYQSPLSKAKNLGSAKHGSQHWYLQRFSAVLLFFLGLYIIFSLCVLVSQYDGDVQIFTSWLHSPIHGLITILFFVTALMHALLGLQVVIEDYVHGMWHFILLIIVRALCYGLIISNIIAILLIMLG